MYLETFHSFKGSELYELVYQVLVPVGLWN